MSNVYEIVTAGVLDARIRQLGETHPDTLATMTNVAAIMIGQGDNASAIGLLERSLTKCRDTLGASHPQTFGAAYHLVVALLRAGEDSDRLRELIGRDLAPLADADPASLSAELRGIRLRLIPLIQSLQMPD
jgi:Tetratricopeptide repeat